ncbi:hypothetical protein FUAX_33420 [Fulvitalea axinellae]|uniref:Lipoprotein n=1 Tax=Fulvitalea axinellae TaxID=1182444 RepID=A0AAU9CNC4_9BACT|nr:hypothetical protein FUAX_33420 [Fulvitalea axinellae]
MRGQIRIWTKLWLSVLALPLVFAVGCSNDDDDDGTPGGVGTTTQLTEDQKRILGEWKNEIQGYDSECKVAVTEYYELDFSGAGQFEASYSQKSDDVGITCDDSENEQGTFGLNVVTAAEQKEWADAFPQITVKLDYQLITKTTQETDTAYVQFLDPATQGGVTEIRLFYDDDGDKSWLDLKKQ